MIIWGDIIPVNGAAAVVYDYFDGVVRDEVSIIAQDVSSSVPPRTVHPVAVVGSLDDVDVPPVTAVVFVRSPRLGLEQFSTLMARLPEGTTGYLHDPSEVDSSLIEEALAGELPLVVETLTREVDLEAEKARLRYISNGAGQALEYRLVETEAEKFLSGAPGNFYALERDVIAGVPSAVTRQPVNSVREAAESIIAARDVWAQKAVDIRGTRLKAKAEISNAQTRQEAEDIARASIEALRSV